MSSGSACFCGTIAFQGANAFGRNPNCLADFSARPASRFINGKVFAGVLQKHRRCRKELGSKLSNLRVRSSLPDLVDIAPAMPQLTEGIASFSCQCTQRIVNLEMFSPFLRFVSERADLSGFSKTAFIQQAANLRASSLYQATQILPAQISEVVNNICVKINNFNGAVNVEEELSHMVASMMHGIESLNQFFRSAAFRYLSESQKITLILQALAEKFAASASQLLAQLGTALGISHGSISTDIFPLNNTFFATVAGSAVASSAIVLASLNGDSFRSSFVEGEDLPLRYDAELVAAYFKQRPMDIISRSSKIFYECFAFATSLLMDKSAGLEKANEKQRAAELVVLITRLGPTAIKIGQALSIRPDILPAAYIEELQKLQDRVPPFPNAEARQIILEGLGKPVEDIFLEISEDPVAAASLGQVYKARLRGSGKLVAVKVQRPGILEGISRDLYLLRSTARALQCIPNLHSDLVALLDNWAYRFFDELDYVQEAKNMMRFKENMRIVQNIIVPEAYMEYTSRKVLTCSWVEGEKLFESKADDKVQLVKTALNCYLIQLLESGFLHADPHPGNLLRTPDGCLCVLDFGLMTEVTEDQRYAFVEYIAHLSNSDYARVAEDLVKLGFVPPELVDPKKTVAVVPQLSRVLGQLVQGGGARKVNIQQVIDDLSKMTEEYIFVIPPYFALILRAFSVLEGIGLEANPDFTIVKECIPYLSKRLVTDDSPRTRATLKYFLYAGKEYIDVTRVEQIIFGFQTFLELTNVPVADGSLNRLPSRIDPAAKEVLHLLFAPDGSYIQELLLTELVRAIDALSRDAMAELWHYIASRVLIPLPPPLSVPKSWPVLLPGLFFGSSPVATLSEEDEQSLETVRRLIVLLVPQLKQSSFVTEAAKAAFSIMPLFPDLLPGIAVTMQRLFLMLIQRQALRLADDLDGRKSIMARDKSHLAATRRIKNANLLPPSQPSTA